MDTPIHDGQILSWAKPFGHSAYLESSNLPINLQDGIITENGLFWREGAEPDLIVCLIREGLCGSYDEEAFNWELFEPLGSGRVEMSPTPHLVKL